MIKKILFKYFYHRLQNVLNYFGIFNENEKNLFLDGIQNNNLIDEIEQTIQDKINKYDLEQIENILNLFKKCQQNINIELNIISIVKISDIKKIPLDWLQNYISKELEIMIFKYYISYNDILSIFCNLSHDYILNNIKDYSSVYNLYSFLESNKSMFYYIYLQFYFYISKKYTPSNFIFPVMVDDKIISSRVYSVGGASIENVQNDLKMLASEPYINNVYSDEEIERIETLLENKKINSLIKSHKLTLAPNFETMIKDIASTDKFNKEDTTKLINNIFKTQDSEQLQDETKKNIQDVIDQTGDKDVALKYLIEKIAYSNMDNKDSSNIKNLNEVFKTIQEINLKDNSLQLTDPDMKFILMLETINAIKSSIGTGNKNSNVTLNVYKDIQKVKINDKDIDIN